jgi:hypothetical protein
MTVAWPHHACVPLSKRRQHHLARSTCAAAPVLRSSSLGANTVCKPRNSFPDALFTQRLIALMPPTICCVRAQSVRDFVTEFSQAVPRRTEAVWLRARALSSRPKLTPASPIVAS